MKPETYSDAVVRMGRVGPFAPGDYVCSCINCGIQFYGDKRALSCLPCAVAVREEGRQSAGERVKALEEALRELHHWTLRSMKTERKKIAAKGPGRELYDRVEALLSPQAAPAEQKDGAS